MDGGQRLSRMTIFLHWVVAIAILALSAVGIYMAETETWSLYDWHKSFGLIVFVLVIARVVWRIKNGLPQPVRPYSRFEHAASKAAHVLLLVGTVAMPLTGMLFSGAGGYGFALFGIEIFPSRYKSDGQPIPFNASLADWGQSLHEFIGYTLLALIAIHFAGALKHHFLDRDRALTRMLGDQGDT